MIVLEPDLELTTSQAEDILEAWLDARVTCTEVKRLKGGMVNSVFSLRFDRVPNQAVVKLHGMNGNSFEREALALEHLHTETECPVPEVYLQDSSGQIVPYAFLLLEAVSGVCLDSIDLDPADRADIDTQLADILAELHRHTGSSWGRIGVDEEWATWSECFVNRLVEARAHPALAERLSPEVLEAVDDAIDAAPALLSDAGRPTLVHADVWDGNLMVHRQGEKWELAGVLDPNLQFADREIELAYLEVFDNAKDVFFDRYLRHHDERPGYEQRRLWYWLHTALIHVALFDEQFFGDYTSRLVREIGRVS